jgi:hypothetical protein
MPNIRHAPFALRVVQRKDGKAGIIYQRRPNADGNDRLQRVGSISPLAFTAGTPLMRDAVSKSNTNVIPANVVPPTNGRNKAGIHKKLNDKQSNNNELKPGPFFPLDSDWGAKVACFAIISSGLRDGERLLKTVGHIRNADPNESAWWLGLLTKDDNVRALRALRILTEAVQ